MIRRGVLTLALALLASPGPASEIGTRVGDARWNLEKVGAREVWGPRTTTQRVLRIRALVAEAGGAEQPVTALARALVALGRAPEAEAAYRTWAGSHPDPATGAQRLGEWLVGRRRAKEALAAFEVAAKGREGATRAAVYTRMLEVVERLRPEGVETTRLHEARVAADPGERSHAAALLADIAARRGVDAALTRLDGLAAGDPGEWVSEKVSLLEQGERLAEARQLLEAEWDRRRDLASARELALFLRRIDAYEERVGELVEGWSSEALSDADLELTAHLRQLYPYDHDLRELPDLAALVASLADRWQDRGPVELGRLGDLWAEAQEPGEALRAYLAALERSRGGPGEAAARRSLVRAALAMEDPGDALRPPGQTALRPYLLDPHPGVVTGFASLLWSDFNASEVARQVATNLASDAAVARVDAWLAKEWRDAPGDPRLEPLLERFVARLQRRGLHRRGADVWLKFAEQIRDPEASARHRLAALKVLERAETSVREAVRPTLERWARKVLERAEAAGWDAVAAEAFGILERSLKARRDQAGVIALYRRELDKGEPDASTLDRFLNLLTSYSMHGELDAVYDRALGAFPERNWFDKAARWYVRQRRLDAFAQVSRRAVRELAAGELAGYLGGHTRLAQSGRGAGRDRALYLELYRGAHERFPHDLRFVDGLLRYYDFFRQDQEAEDLAFRYAARRADLADRVWQARLRRGSLAGTVKALAAARGGSRAAAVLLARAHEWLSRFEEARPVWQRLASQVPDERDLLEAAARSLRSLGEPLQAVALYQQLAAQEPGNREWPALVGEMRIEGGDLEGAKAAWREIGRATPGDPEGWRVAATVLWDYYLFDDAVTALAEGRKVLGDPRAFGAEMEALHEGRGAWEEAAQEAVAGMVHRGGNDWPMLQRLGVLGRKGHREKIQATLVQSVVAGPTEAAPVRALLAVLDEWGVEWPQVSPVLTELVPALAGRQPLQVILARARSQLDVDLEGAVLQRLAAVRQREPRALLELLAYASRVGDDARVRALAAEIHVAAGALPNTLRGRAVRLFGRLGQALWTHGDRDQALLEWRAGVERARGGAARGLRLALARRLVEAGQPDQAREELSGLLVADPTDLDAVVQLAEVSLRLGRGEDLVGLYQAADRRLEEAEGLSADTRKARRLEVKRRLVADLYRAGRKEELGPRLAELVLAERGDEGLAGEAWRLARVSGQTAQLLGPLERYAEESPKDFRAHRLLAWMAEFDGDLESAARHLGRAVAEEPQRAELRQRRMQLLLRRGDYDAARQELAALEARSSQGPVDYAEARARLERLAGRPGPAREALEKLQPASLSSQEDARRLERYAAALWETGELPAAWSALTRLLESMERDGPLVWSPSWGDARRWVEWTRVVHGPAEAFRRSQARASRLRLVKGDGYTARVRRWCADWLDDHRERALLDAARDRGPAADRRELAGVLRELGPEVFDHPESALARAGFEDLLHAYLSRSNDDDLWKHLEEAGRLDELDGKLAAGLASGDSGAQARKATRLAELRRARNQPALELAALRAAPYARGPTWYLSDPARRRMLDLVLDLEGEAALADQLAVRGLWGVNEALRRERGELAARLLAEHFGPRAPGGPGEWVKTSLRWRRDAYTQVAASFELPPAGVDAAFDGLLDRRPVGLRLASPPDPQEAMVGDGFFPVAARYARWLLARGRRDEALGYATAPSEGRPRHAGSELETAALLHQLGREEDARRRLEAASASRPGDWAIEERVVRLLHGWGEREEALRRLKAWGGPKTLSEGWWRDLLRIGDALGESATTVAWLQEELAKAGPGVPVEWLEEVVSACEERVDLAGRNQLRVALLASWRDDGPRAEMLARRAGATAAFRIEAFEHVLASLARAPARVRLDYQRRMAAAATRAGDPTRARQALEAVAQLAAELEAAGESVADLRPERARRRFALGDPEGARDLLAAYLGPEEEAGGAKARWVEAHRVLAEAGREAEAAALRRRYYRARERLGGGRSGEVLAGLMREALLADNTGEAKAVAERLAALDSEGGPTLGWVGRTLAAAGLSSEAVSYLARAVRVRPADLELRLALGEAELGSAATLGAGLETLAGLVVDRRADGGTRERAMAALRRAAPSQADLEKYWRPALPEPDASFERLWGEAEAATGRGDFEAAAHLFGEAGAIEPVASEPWKELLRLHQREPGGDPEAARLVLEELQRREAAQPGPSSRFTRHRLFWARARGGGAAGSLSLLDLESALRRLRERVERSEEDATWEAILGGSAGPGVEAGYSEVVPGAAPGGTSLGLAGWGGDAGVEEDPFALEALPQPVPEAVAELAEGLPADRFLMAVATAREGAGDLEGAAEAWIVAEAMEVPAAAEALARVRRSIADERLQRERRLVLASE